MSDAKNRSVASADFQFTILSVILRRSNKNRKAEVKEESRGLEES